VLQFYKQITSDLQSIRPFRLYKSWEFTTSSYDCTSNNVSAYIKFYNAPSNYNINLYDAASSGSQSGSVWYSINNLYYRDNNVCLAAYYNLFTTHSFTTNSNAVVVSIPQSKFGESVSEKSVQFKLSSQVNIPYLSNGNTSDSIQLIDDGDGNLMDILNTYYTGTIGNVAYTHGLLIFTDQEYYNYITSSMFTDFSKTMSTLTYTSYYTAYEHEYICTCKSDEFNSTKNPTAYKIGPNGIPIFNFYETYDSSGSQFIFKPFVTGVGLYDESGQLVCTSKFAKPIKIENNSDMVFIVKFDT